LVIVGSVHVVGDRVVISSSSFGDSDFREFQIFLRKSFPRERLLVSRDRVARRALARNCPAESNRKVELQEEDDWCYAQACSVSDKKSQRQERRAEHQSMDSETAKPEGKRASRTLDGMDLSSR